MAEISPWDEFERAMEDIRKSLARKRPFGDVREPYMDMIERSDEIEVVAELPGVKKEDIDISVEGDMLTISADVKNEKEEEKGNYLYRERSYKRFARKIALPANVDVERAKSRFENGTLRIVFPKIGGKGRKINIE